MQYTNDMKYINLTPHEITIMDDKKIVVLRVPKSGQEARLDVTRRPYSIAEDGVAFSIVIYGHPYLLESETQEKVSFPEKDEDTILIVSAMFADGMSRDDLWSPGELVRDEKGVPIGCIGLCQKGAPVNKDFGVILEDAHGTSVKKYVYFVTYFYKHVSGFGFGNCEVVRNHPLQSIDDVREMEKAVLGSIQSENKNKVSDLSLSSAPTLLSKID